MAKYVFSVLVIALAWAVWFVIPTTTLAIPIAITGIIVATLVGLVLVRRYRAHRAARDIEQALKTQSEQQVQNADNEHREAVKVMQRDFLRALQELKKTRVGKLGPAALSELPWYLVVGPPGSGKTTAIKASGLQFPIANGNVKGLGGTRNCDWWMTNDGLILDTAGRWMSEDTDHDEWLSFLDMLKTHRERQPINGVIVAFSVTDVMQSHDEDIRQSAQKARSRIQEIATRLDMQVPVYLVFTKCDLLSGFVETFSDMSKQQRSQIWGYTVPFSERHLAPEALFNERFHEVLRIVQQRTLKRLSQERKIDIREKIYTFPQQLESAKTSLATFVNVLFADDDHHSSAIMRGVYFTSGTQEGNPVDRALEAMQKLLNVTAPSRPRTLTESKSYFLREVFSNVIFPDRDLATRSSVEQRRAHRRNAWALAASGLLATMMLVIPGYAYYQNKRMLSVSDFAQRMIADFRSQHQGEAIDPIALAPLRDYLEQLSQWKNTRPPLRLRFGMYQGEHLYQPVLALYKNTLSRDVIDPILAEDVQVLQTFAQRYSSATDPVPMQEQQQAYVLLKTYLLITKQAQGNIPRLRFGLDPSHDDTNTRLVVEHLERSWTERLRQQDSDDVSPEVARNIREHIRMYLRLYSQAPGSQHFAFNEGTVQQVQRILNRTSSVNVAYERLRTETVQAGFQDLSLQRIIGTNHSPIRSTGRQNERGNHQEYVIPAMFTRRAWEGYVRSHMTAIFDQINGESWVLGSEQNVLQRRQEREQSIADLETRYAQDYARHWNAFIQSLSIVEPSDHMDALRLLQDLTRGEVPVHTQIIREIGYNARLLRETSTQQQAQAGVLSAVGNAIRQRISRQSDATQLAAMHAENLARVGQTALEARGIAFKPENIEAEFEGFFAFAYQHPAPTPTNTLAGNQPAQPPPPPLQILAYYEQLRTVRDALQTYVDNPSSEGATQRLLGSLQTAQTQVEGLVQSQDVGWRPDFQRILRPPIDFTVRQAQAAIMGPQSANYCTAVFQPFQQRLLDRYPFNPDGHDAALRDVVDFYRPQTGTLAQYTRQLQGYVTRVGTRHQYVQSLRQVSSDLFTSEFVPFLDQSAAIQSILFPTGENPVQPAPTQGDNLGVHVEFEVRIRPAPTVATVTFTVDGQSIEYHNGPEQWHTMQWPGSGRTRGATLRIQGAGNMDEVIEQEGEWGLFRLIEQGNTSGNTTGRVMTVTWTLHDQHIPIVMDIRPASSVNPFQTSTRPHPTGTEVLAPFRDDHALAPVQIASNSGPCNQVQSSHTNARRTHRTRQTH